MRNNDGRCLIIAEAGVNHNGSLDTALKLCDAAKVAGADVVKFQTYKTENLITRNVKQAKYQTENTGKAESQFDMLKSLELTEDDFRKIKEHCDMIGIAFCSTAHDSESYDFLVKLGIMFAKVASGDIGNISYLRQIGRSGLPVILSTGMSTIDRIKISVDALKEGGAGDITILHCTTSYPCSYKDVNLKAMTTIRDEFKCSVGYSDHTVDSSVAIAAVAMGADVIEKHFTLDKNMPGPDHKASLNPNEFADFVRKIRDIENALGDGVKGPSDAEKEISKVVLKRIVAKREIKKGQIISEEDVCVKRNNVGIKADKWDEVIGTVATCDYDVDEAIHI